MLDSISRRAVLQATTALSLLGLRSAIGQDHLVKPGGSRSNLILFYPDELRADALGCYGNPICKTPNFDLLARRGVRFANCHVQYPICGASRCSLLTGWMPGTHGHRSQSYFLRPDEPNMFRYLKQAGYDVFWFGKNDALAQESFADSVTVWKDATPRQTPALLKMMEAINKAQLVPGVDTMLLPPFGTRTSGSDYQNLKWAIEILERTEAEEPFCIFIPLVTPHPPYSAPSEFQTMYKPEDLPPLIPSGLPKKPAFYADLRRYMGLEKATDRDLRQVRAVYYGKVSYTDWLLGELLEALERTGRAKDTALFVGSDHGDYAGDYGLVEKWPSGMEDCLTHVPLVGSIPGGRAGVVDQDMVALFDIMPTLLELGGTKPTHTNYARSLAPQLHGQPGGWRSAVFTEGGYNTDEPQAFEPELPGFYAPRTGLEHDRPMDLSRTAAIRTAAFKYVERPQGQSELYDLRRDRDLRNNLIDETAHAKTRGRLQRELLDWSINTAGYVPQDKDPRDIPLQE